MRSSEAMCLEQYLKFILYLARPYQLGKFNKSIVFFKNKSLRCNNLKDFPYLLN